MKKLFAITLLCFSVAACDNEPETLKSPCVGAFDSPCGEKRPANPHMMHQYKVRV